jgi:hypothetical protein
VREAQGDTNLPANGSHLYRVEAELKLLVLRLFVSLIYRPMTNHANSIMKIFISIVHFLRFLTSVAPVDCSEVLATTFGAFLLESEFIDI